MLWEFQDTVFELVILLSLPYYDLWKAAYYNALCMRKPVKEIILVSLCVISLDHYTMILCFHFIYLENNSGLVSYFFLIPYLLTKLDISTLGYLLLNSALLSITMLLLFFYIKEMRNFEEFCMAFKSLWYLLLVGFVVLTKILQSFPPKNVVH